jgi:hypothetical protein
MRAAVMAPAMVEPMHGERDRLFSRLVGCPRVAGRALINTTVAR